MKTFLLKVLCNSFTGKVISILFNYNIPNCRNQFKRYQTPKLYCNDYVRSLIFFGFYERAEIRLLQNYLPKNTPVIELGSSLGIVSSIAINHLNKDVSYTCIEANPYLIDFININISKHNLSKKSIHVMNVAIDYNKDGFVDIEVSQNNTESKISSIGFKTKNTQRVKSITLKEVVSRPYTLVCDIEGAEIQILKNDSDSLKLCKYLFVELHKTVYEERIYNVEDLKNLIVDLGFELRAKDGNVFFFTNTNQGYL